MLLWHPKGTEKGGRAEYCHSGHFRTHSWESGRGGGQVGELWSGIKRLEPVPASAWLLLSLSLPAGLVAVQVKASMLVVIASITLPLLGAQAP